MGDAGLHRAIANGAPLADVSVTFRAGVDGVAATQLINSIADDFDLHPSSYYDDPLCRIGSATKEALERLFGWRLQRVPLPRWDEKAQKYDGFWPDSFKWDTVTPATRYPEGLEVLIKSMGFSQPGGRQRAVVRMTPIKCV